PGHKPQQTSHAAPACSTSKHQSGTNKGRQGKKGGRDEISEKHTQQNQGTRCKLDLSYQFKRLTLIRNNGKANSAPCVDATLNHIAGSIGGLGQTGGIGLGPRS